MRKLFWLRYVIILAGEVVEFKLRYIAIKTIQVLRF